MRKILLLMPLLAVASAASAGDKPVYSLSTPGVTPIYVRSSESATVDKELADWASANASVAISSAQYVLGAESTVPIPDRSKDPSAPVYTTPDVIVGFPAERNKPLYYLGEELIPPDGVDWEKTYQAFAATAEIQDNFLFNTIDKKVYVTRGETVKFPWVVATGAGTFVTNEYPVVASPVSRDRPKNIFWTDTKYGGSPIDISGKFVKFFGPENILKKVMGKESTGTTMGDQMSYREVVKSGLYVDDSVGGRKMIYAAGELKGQVVMAYYDSATYDHIVDVQAIEVSPPQTIVCTTKVGAELHPTGRGYNITNLEAMPSTLNDFDAMGPFLYQHKGQFPYSPKNGSVFALRPADDKTRNQTRITWNETDRQGVKWPFEVNEYRVSWPEDAMKFVRSENPNDPGRAIRIPEIYTAQLQKWQQDLDDVPKHAREVEDGKFLTYGPGYSLLKITGEDNIWFLPIESILRTDTSWFDLTVKSGITVGKPILLRGGSLTGLAEGRSLEMDPYVPGYIYEPASSKVWNPNIYDASGTCADGIKSVIYPVTASMAEDETDEVEVWWSTSFKAPDMSTAINVPSLPQVSTIRWPKANEAAQIVLASQKGSAGDSIYCDGATLAFDGENACVELPSRQYFGKDGGAVMMWIKTHEEAKEKDIKNSSALLTINATNGTSLVKIDLRSYIDSKDEKETVRAVVGTNVLEVACGDPYAWRHVALGWSTNKIELVVREGNDERSAVNTNITEKLRLELAETMGKSYLGAKPNSDEKTRNLECIDELQMWRRTFTRKEFSERAAIWARGTESGLSFFMPVLANSTDLIYDGQTDARQVVDLVFNTTHKAVNCLRDEPGAPHKASIVFGAESEARLYRQANKDLSGYNPNEEHAFIEKGEGGYVAWALRCDLNHAEEANDHPAVSEPGVLVEYMDKGERKMRYFHVIPKSSIYPNFGGVCTAGAQLPGPQPLLMFDNPWLKETYWDENANEPFRDRKGQVWARCAGEFNIYMYYAQQDGFDWPSGVEDKPAIGDPVPWLAYLSELNAGILPEPWHWTVNWPENVPELKIAQTLTTAENGLPEMWNAKSMAILYPITNVADVVMLTDPTIAQGKDLDLSASQLAEIGLKTGPGEKLLERKGVYYFQGVSPSLSQRLYIDPSTNRLVLKGVKESNPGGVELLHVNVLSQEDYESVLALVKEFEGKPHYNTFKKALDEIKALPPKEPTEVKLMNRGGHEQATAIYQAPDHYSLVTMGMTNWVVVIENDATNKFCEASNPINMHVMKVIPEYYTGRVVTREDPNNLLSQVLGVHYSDPLSGRAENFIFDWRKAAPSITGEVPYDFDNDSVYKSKFSEKDGVGRTSFSIGGQGDTLANMVNSYYTCRYRAADKNSPAYKVMGDKWSDWVTPPALAEGWVQRVLNNITPFTQRMTDLYNNEAETAVSWMQQAGKPFMGDVALNQDNLTSVGLIELYRTILNKAESMSLLQRVNNGDANKQLLLAVERLADLYKLLGDEAYSDAANPTIGFGSNFGDVETGLQLDYGAASSSLFAFDNQMPTLLDEELALLRGRSCVDAPGNTIGPYYNRLVWNFTKGITAGEVAYAVNYNISGRKTSTLTASTAAELYPQGHGDAYGHYLSALQGWYRLLRNPYFSWGVPAMGEMNVADNVVNVDYYDEAKFAETAASVARTAERVVELTAVKHYRDNAADAVGGGYLDSNADNAFGVGEWASRGTFGALCNWAVANSLLPEEEKNDGDGVPYEDKGLKHIDRGTVPGLTEMVAAVESIQETLDRLDADQNPLGLDPNAIPFDLTPLGSAKDATHYEQIRERAAGAFDNAKKILDRAQEYSNRLRILEESRAGMVDNLDDMEADLTAQLIAIYGRPYNDDVGPGKTYPQGYDGPDFFHYMWMDKSAYGINTIEDTIVATSIVYSVTYTNNNEVVKVEPRYLHTQNKGVLEFKLSASGLILKPDDVEGERPAIGELQLAYAEFLRAYGGFKGSISNYDRKVQTYEFEKTMALAQANASTELQVTVDKVYGNYSNSLEYYINVLSGLKNAKSVEETALSIMKVTWDKDKKISGTIGLATTLLLDGAKETKGFGLGIANTIAEAAKLATETAIAQIERNISQLNRELAAADRKNNAVTSKISNWERLFPKVQEVEVAVGQMEGALKELQSKQEGINSILDKGRRLQETRRLQRQQAVNNIAKMRYNDTFFRKLRNETLSKYDVAFRQAQMYAFLAAKAYCYETGSSMDGGTAGGDLIRQIVGARALGETDASGRPIVSANGDAGLAGALAKLDANWAVAKTQLGINNPQPYATWFSLRHGLFRILPDETGDDAWRTELSKYWVDDIRTAPDFVRYCLPFASQFGLADKEPGLVIPFETTIDFAKNLFGKDLAFDDAQFDSSWYATKIAAAGVWFEGYNEKREGYKGQSAFATTPNVYLVPVGTDKMRAPGADGEEIVSYNVIDQTVPVPHPLTKAEIEEANRLPLYTDGTFGGVDAVTRIRRHPSFRAYFGPTGSEPSDAELDATRLTGRSVWNTKWMLVIPAGTLNANREEALKAFIEGLDVNRDGIVDVKGVRDIRIGFKTYSHSGK